jgi:hypothetical protein
LKLVWEGLGLGGGIAEGDWGRYITYYSQAARYGMNR